MLDTNELLVIVITAILGFYFVAKFFIEAVSGTKEGLENANTTDDVAVSAAYGCMGCLGGSFALVFVVALLILGVVIYMET